jgi:hypothetical protein
MNPLPKREALSRGKKVRLLLPEKSNLTGGITYAKL